MIRSFDFLKGQPLETPVYYIDNEKESISSVDKWKCSYLNKFYTPGYDKDCIIDAQF